MRFALCALALAFALVPASSGACASGSAPAFESGGFPIHAAPVLAAASDEALSGAAAFIDKMGARAIGFLSNPDMSQEQRKAKFRSLLREHYDMDTIARFALGKYWRLASEKQRKDYRRLFEDMVVAVYARRFEEYNGQKFEVRGQRAEGERDSLVTSYIVPGDGAEFRVDWRVRKKGGGYRIVDVIVEGVSMAMTQRQDFSAVIQKGGGDVQTLIDHLREQNR